MEASGTEKPNGLIMGKRGNKRKPVPPLKRLIHFEDGEVWSWAQAGTGVKIRSPGGKTTYVHSRNFLEPVFLPRRDCDSYLSHWCSGSCYGCTPKFRGGYKPSVLKDYIQTVFREGKTWVNPLDREMT